MQTSDKYGNDLIDEKLACDVKSNASDLMGAAF